MAAYGAFSISTLGMKSQAHAMGTIGDNISNMMTGGYKRTETKFSGILSKSLFEQSDIGGNKTKDFQRIENQGNLITGDSPFDLAINGKGFFVLNTALSGGKTVYGRDGSFSEIIGSSKSISETKADGTTSTFSTNDGYLVDKNGYYVQGWAANTATSGFSASLKEMKIDPYAFFGSGVPTTSATLALNLPANDPTAPLQVDTVTLAGTVEAGDIYSVTVDGTTVSYTVKSTDTSLDTIRNGLVSAINADTTVAAKLSASAGSATGSLTLTAKDISAPINITAAATNIATVAQSDTVTIGGTFEVGDVYTATVGSNVYSYTSVGGDSNTTAATSLAALINADAAVSASATGSVITITAATAGTPYTLTAVGATGGADTTQTATSAVVTANSGAANTASYVKTKSPYQVETVTLGGTVGAGEAGDKYSVTIDGTTVSYTVTGSEADLNAIRDGLVSAINADTTVKSAVIASAGSSTGELTLTSKTLNSSVVVTSTATNGGTISDNTATEASLLTGTTVNYKVGSIDVYDSNGNLQPVTLNFVKTDTNKWQISTTTSQTTVAQVDTVTLAGTVEAGDIYSATVDGTTVSYTVTGAEADLNAVRDGLVTAINADTTLSNKVTAAAGTATGALTLTAKKAGTAFNATSSATNITAVAQSDTITVGGTFEVGDVYTATIGSNVYSYTSVGGDSNGTVATSLAALINADSAVSASAAASVITITSATAGTPYTLSAVGATGGIDATQSATAAVVTANSGVADNTATLANTTANVTSTVTSTSQNLTFDGNGQLTSTSPITLSLTFDGGSTATVSLDISSFNQYAGDFSTASYTKNGRSGGVVNKYNFDATGQVIANFADGSSRAVYKIPIAVFANANALDKQNGNTFAETTNSGTANVVAADSSGFASFAPGFLELSNVNVADEFSRMIMTQQAYTASSKVFKTIDEMLMAARDLK